MIRYAETPLGRNPNQIDYADYREVDSVEALFRIITSQPENTCIFQFEEVRQNLPIDPAEFAKPQPVSPSH